MIAEKKRLEAQSKGMENWRLWGPYLAERAWGTVREDYSHDGDAWRYFGHDQAALRAYRWNEDGLGGICDEGQRICLAITLWNGLDPILKERAFGLTGLQGNHGEDVKEYYFYLDATPTHSYLRYLYKYPQREYPYKLLVEENRKRSRYEPAFSLLDAGAFADNRYWDVEVVYAKPEPESVYMRITIHNRGPERATLHLLPTLWFRNTWSWEDEVRKPRIYNYDRPEGAMWGVWAEHPELGVCHLFGAQRAELLFTENETNHERLWGVPNATPYTKDAFHRYIIDGETKAVNPAREGTKFAAWHRMEVSRWAAVHVDLLLAQHSEKEHRKGILFPTAKHPFKGFEGVLEECKAEADKFYAEVLPGASGEDAMILRQALSGLIWNKQFYHYSVARWLDGDGVKPADNRKRGRNNRWRHLAAADVISMPDKWEYPWFAAWDVAFHCVAMSLIDIDFAKEQLELLISNRYIHPNGHIPAYEWDFENANPPVQAWAALECFRAERARRGKGDTGFLRRVFNKLALNYIWWLNRKDPDNRSVFEGGFLGLDNISVYDRSKPLPHGFSLKQADASGWMAMFALNMTVMAIELAQEDPCYEDMAIQFHGQFFAIASAMHGYTETGISLWDPHDSFFKDAVAGPDGFFQLPVFSWVGLIPIFGCEIVGPEPLKNMPRYTAFLENHAGGNYDGHIVCACPHTVNIRGEHLFSLALPADLPSIIERVLNPEEFFSPYGIRSVSRLHVSRTDLGVVPGIGETIITYEPGESQSGLFGGNSNWRGPVWMPLNFIMVDALDKLHRYLTGDFKVNAPCLGGQKVHLGQAADIISGSLANIFHRNDGGLRPAYPDDSPLQNDPHWQDMLLFYEYFHADNGEGLGAKHQTGWTALVANILRRRYVKAAASVDEKT